MPILRVALVGCGLISEAHTRAYSKHADRARITVCCDIDSARAAARAEAAGGARVATDYADVLSDPDVDAIELCTPHHLHADAVVAAAWAGKHVLCQKPLAKTLAECDRMIAAASAAGIVLFYGEMNRTLPSAVAARALVDTGRIGKLVGLQATYAHWQGGEYLKTAWRYDPAVSGGGALLDGGIHFVDLLLHIGGPIEAVSCTSTRVRAELGGEDTSVLNLRFRLGQLGTLFSSQAAGTWYPESSLVIFGSEGVITMGGFHGGLKLYGADRTKGPEVLRSAGEDSFKEMIGKYLDCVLDGAPNPSPPSVGRDNLQVVLAAYQSARLGREVRLDEVTG